MRARPWRLSEPYRLVKGVMVATFVREDERGPIATVRQKDLEVVADVFGVLVAVGAKGLFEAMFEVDCALEVKGYEIVGRLILREGS